MSSSSSSASPPDIHAIDDKPLRGQYEQLPRSRPAPGSAAGTSGGGWSSQAGHLERRCLSPRPWRANVRSWRRRLWGGWSSQATPRPRRRGESDGQALGRAAERVVDGLRLARAATTCRRRVWDGQRVSPVVPPAGAEVVPAGTADRGDALGGVSAVTVPTAGAVRESTTIPAGRGFSRRCSASTTFAAWRRLFLPVPVVVNRDQQR